MSGKSAPLSVGFPPIPTHPPSRPGGPAEDSGHPAHRPAGPAGGRCACGRPREGCVRDAVREVWTAPAPAEGIGRGLPERDPGDRITAGEREAY